MIPAGMMTERVRVLTKARSVGMFNEQVKEWTYSKTVWANVKFAKGARALNQGEEWTSQQIVVTMANQSGIDEGCKLQWDGKMYVIDSFNRSKVEGTITIVAVKEDEGTGE